MRYLPELYYFQDKAAFPFRKAVQVTASAVTEFCSHYSLEVLAPKENGDWIRIGELPKDSGNKKEFIVTQLEWIFQNSFTEELFRLYLDDKPIETNESLKFGHHDDTCCWELSLSDDEFKTLQSVWEKHALPTDLFYPEHLGVCVEKKPKIFLGKVFWKLGLRFQRCYSPKQWEIASKH
ncbi:MAG: hypothetical protein WCP97_01755 [bacterium]